MTKVSVLVGGAVGAVDMTMVGYDWKVGGGEVYVLNN